MAEGKPEAGLNTITQWWCASESPNGPKGPWCDRKVLGGLNPQVKTILFLKIFIDFLSFITIHVIISMIRGLRDPAWPVPTVIFRVGIIDDYA